MAGQRRRGFVKHQYARRVPQRTGDLHNLLFCHAEVGNQAVRIDLQRKMLADRPARNLAQATTIQQTHAGINRLLAQQQRFRHRQAGGQQALLMHNLNAQRLRPARRINAHRLTVEADLSTIGGLQPAEDLDERRFSCPVMANQAVNLPGARLRDTPRRAGTPSKALLI